MDGQDRIEASAQDFGFVLAGVVAALWRHGERTAWHGAWIRQAFDELCAAAAVLATSRQLQEQVVADSEIVAELYRLATRLDEPSPDFQWVAVVTRRLWRSMKPYAP